MPQNIKLGVLLALAGSIFYTVMSVFVKLLGSEQSTATILFARFFLGFFLLLPWFLTDKNLFHIDNKGKILLRCITTVLAMACMFYALKYMPVANALLLNITFPLFMPLLVWVMLKIKTSMKILVGIIIGFLGVAIILNPSANAFNWHALIALLSGVLAALAMLQIRLLTHSSSAKQILFYLFAFGAIATGVFVPFSFEIPTYYQLFLLFLVALFGAVYQLFVTLALEYAPARIVSPIYFSCIIFSVLSDWLIWSVEPGLMELFGMVLIVIGGLITVLMAESK